ncbi:YdcF family protein [Hyphococcus sp. DH-69]|uniref:YdcF family protein n=1 Tax=Hyphococcus formosus TaxID=3143534 RepID=UPI00398AD79D
MRQLISSLTGIGILWAIGLLIFVAKLPPTNNMAPNQADGIVVYTGGGGARIVAAMDIFEKGNGKRLLISGVHPNTSRARLSEFWTGDPDRFDCCVDLGREAMSTKGNASELKNWASTHAFTQIVLVTSEYHMPRAILETSSKMPDAKITPYAVSSGYLDSDGKPTSLKSGLRLAGEYSKYLLAHFKGFIDSIGA